MKVILILRDISQCWLFRMVFSLHVLYEQSSLKTPNRRTLHTLPSNLEYSLKGLLSCWGHCSSRRERVDLVPVHRGLSLKSFFSKREPKSSATEINKEVTRHCVKTGNENSNKYTWDMTRDGESTRYRYCLKRIRISLKALKGTIFKSDALSKSRPSCSNTFPPLGEAQSQNHDTMRVHALSG